MVTPLPLWAASPFQEFVIFWSPGKVKPSVQPLIGDVPGLEMVTLATKPQAHWLWVEYLTVQAPAGAATDQVNVVDPDAPVASRTVTVTVDVPPAVGVPEISPVEELIDRPAGRPAAL